MRGCKAQEKNIKILPRLHGILTSRKAEDEQFSGRGYFRKPVPDEGTLDFDVNFEYILSFSCGQTWNTVAFARSRELYFFVIPVLFYENKLQPKSGIFKVLNTS